MLIYNQNKTCAKGLDFFMGEIYLGGDMISGGDDRVIFSVLRFLEDIVSVCVVPKLCHCLISNFWRQNQSSLNSKYAFNLSCASVIACNQSETYVIGHASWYIWLLFFVMETLETESSMGCVFMHLTRGLICIYDAF